MYGKSANSTLNPSQESQFRLSGRSKSIADIPQTKAGSTNLSDVGNILKPRATHSKNAKNQ